MKKQPTSGQYGRALLKLNSLITRLYKKYLAAENNPKLSKEQVDAIAEEGLRLMKEEQDKIDEMKKLMK
jgi:hypothetical protein